MQVFNGFSAMLTGDSAKRAADLETLRALPGVSVSRARFVSSCKGRDF
jgi:hypothetical protein